MKYKAYKIQPENMAALAPMTVEFYLEFDEDFVFGYTPVTLAAVCRQSQTMARQLAEKLAAMSGAVVVRNDSEWSRPGLHILLDDRDWLAKMAKVAAAFVADEPVAISATGTTVALLTTISPPPTVSQPTITKVRDVLAVHTEGFRPEPSKSLTVLAMKPQRASRLANKKRKFRYIFRVRISDNSCYPICLPAPGCFMLVALVTRFGRSGAPTNLWSFSDCLACAEARLNLHIRVVSCAWETRSCGPCCSMSPQAPRLARMSPSAS